MTEADRIQKQIIGILKEHEAGVSVADLCRKYGVSDVSIYKWKARFSIERAVLCEAAWSFRTTPKVGVARAGVCANRCASI
ncbi:protein of unknown function [Bradyrhizobium vignae]|uniref:Transposase n=1 Tax=Bradyrhizobium vignae TaxID=1549949 RepID=A0A2U3QA40_9BRAD|nr:protein of unknown function [Bradyrhizobium vignae]